MRYESTLEFIHSVRWQGSKPGLSRTRELLARLGNPEKRLKFVHVAGTNGKGSTCADIASVLRCAGLRVGLFTSPAILRFNERMQINGEMIPDGTLEELTDILRPEAEAMADSPTEFEMMTALGLLWFAREGCDIVVLEVGMGGLLDSTNVIDTPEVAVITPIDLDHTAILGDTVAAIAKEKAGIIKPGGRVVSCPQLPEAEAVLRQAAQREGAELSFADFSRLTVEKNALSGITFSYGDRKDLFTPLAGTYQPRNAALAVEALAALQKRGWPVTEEHIRRGLAAVYWPGRFEVLGEKPTFILDGAHNPHGIRATAESLGTYFGHGSIVFVTGVMADKDYRTMYPMILPLAKTFVCVRPDNPRSLAPAKLAAALRDMGAEAVVSRTVDSGVGRALRLAGKGGCVCALGSLYFSAEVRAAYERRKNKA